ncbi:Uncharacterised protein [Klebsiella michiganensis]|uniref:Uncharacterized protein n=1 Tax=Klebsiella michiganensis TaxID=1134687 RepID=A0A7H4LUX6_9ENTR|nr:Uncharacterised protein [Klebsiella michiganensis]
MSPLAKGSVPYRQNACARAGLKIILPFFLGMIVNMQNDFHEASLRAIES